MVMAGVSAKLIWFRLTGGAIGRRAEESDLDSQIEGHEPYRFMRVSALNS